MSPSSRIAPALSAVATLAIFTVGCANQSAGVAQPIPSGTTTSGSSIPTSPSKGDAALDAIDPCALLTAQEVRQFGANDGKRKDTSRARDCEWLVPGGGGVFGITLRNSQGLNDIDEGAGKLSDQRVGNHDGKLLKEFDGTGACAIIIRITDSSRVDISSAANNDTSKACDYVMRVATLVEPKLPRGE